MIKSNSIPIGWVIHRLENNNIKEVLAVLWRILTPCRLPSLEIQQRDWESPGNLAVRVSGIWLALAEDWGKQTLQSWTAETKFCRHQEPEKRISDPIGDWTKTTCKYWRASCGDVGQQGLTTGLTTLRACPQGWGHQKVSLPIEPVEPKAGSPQVKQLPGREYNHTHQQIIGLKPYWTRPCPPEQDPVFLIDSLSHQAYTSFLASSMKG